MEYCYDSNWNACLLNCWSLIFIAEKVKLVRTELKLSQEDLARELGVSFATINRWENGSYNPSRLARKAFDDFCERKVKNISKENN